MLILAIETSCDETSAAVVKDGREVLSNVISSQIEFHKKYGGIVPEVAARKHIEIITPVIQEALKKVSVSFRDIDAVAVTYGPGLVGSLLVGICAAKAISYSLGIPLIGVNHLEGHIYANYLFAKPEFPFICLMVSGGHTMIVLVRDHGNFKVLGRTRDDAAGEAFDKVARFLQLGYPGGPIIDQLAKQGDPQAINFTRPMLNEGFDFSFSGLKTAVVNYVNKKTGDRRPTTEDIAASFQQAIVDVLVEKSIRAAKKYECKTIALAGGVAANSGLRREMEHKARLAGLAVLIPPLKLCTDNAAMIGCAAYYHAKQQRFSDLGLPAVASLRLV